MSVLSMSLSDFCYVSIFIKMSWFHSLKSKKQNQQYVQEFFFKCENNYTRKEREMTVSSSSSSSIISLSSDRLGINFFSILYVES